MSAKLPTLQWRRLRLAGEFERRIWTYGNGGEVVMVIGGLEILGRRLLLLCIMINIKGPCGSCTNTGGTCFPRCNQQWADISSRVTSMREEIAAWNFDHLERWSNSVGSKLFWRKELSLDRSIIYFINDEGRKVTFTTEIWIQNVKNWNNTASGSILLNNDWYQ